MPSLVKVCCITSFDEARMALNAGADLLGLVSTMPCGPGVISLKKIFRIINLLPRKTKTVLLTSQLTADSISKEYLKVGSWGLQLVDKIGTPELEKLKKSLPKTVLIQAYSCTGPKCHF